MKDIEILKLLSRDSTGELFTVCDPDFYSPEAWGIALADVVKHIANGCNVPPDRIFDPLVAEYKSPTDDIKGRLICRYDFKP